MKKWHNFFHSDVSDEYKNRVMSAADKELAAMQAPKGMPWYLRWQFVGAMAGVAYLFIAVNKQKQTGEPGEMDLLAGDDDEMLEDLDLFEDLELIEELNEETGEFDS